VELAKGYWRLPVVWNHCVIHCEALASKHVPSNPIGRTIEGSNTIISFMEAHRITLLS
jgi:hypothetical protein